MKITITARHFKAHDTLQEYIEAKLAELEKYNEEILHADVILSFEKAVNSVKTCEILLKLRHDLLIGKENSDEFEKAIDMAVEKIDAQIYKYKDKYKDKHKGAPKDTEISKTIEDSVE